ncbi:helix-turn-helix domain-containing protein [Promicromonospora sp. NPDC057488]|uniref:helix-turn-helix domain-containing protein n=1 Tax=Promicromonospora sp. NPDC057488 TaxID=3346147 RepID=UPI00366B19F8
MPPGTARSREMTLPRNTSTSTDVNDARDALARRLRELRRAAGLTGQQLALSLSWQPSKVSKIEHSRQTPSDDDIRAWCRASSAEQETEGLLAALHTLETRHAEWQRQFRGGVASVQAQTARREETTELLRAFEPTFVPGLLQTPGYARHRFTEVTHKFGHRRDIDAAVAERMRRQEILYQPGKRFHMVITEAVLRYALCPPDVMVGQVDRLISLSMLPNVRLGVIPFDKRYAIAPAHGFWIHDDDLVQVETFSAELNLAQPGEVELYTKVFETLALDADYDRKARAHLTRVAEELMGQVEHTPDRPEQS